MLIRVSIQCETFPTVTYKGCLLSIYNGKIIALSTKTCRVDFSLFIRFNNTFSVFAFPRDILLLRFELIIHEFLWGGGIINFVIGLAGVEVAAEEVYLLCK